MIDLHMHSRYSDDGEYTSEELVEGCEKQGIRVMAIADHNCVRANGEAEKEAKRKGICYIPATEIDCTLDGVNFHVLGYGINSESADFAVIENNIEQQSLRASLDMLSATQTLGFRVTENDMWQISKNNYWPGRWTGEMFAEVLLAKPEYETHPLLMPYRNGGSRSDNPLVNFYWDYYSQGKPCYVKTEYPELKQVIDVIHDNHGKAVLAHPGVNLNGKEAMLADIAALGLDGVEVFSSYHSPAQTDYFYNQAKKWNLFPTCGSDFHGKTKPLIHLGGITPCTDMGQEEMQVMVLDALVVQHIL